MKHRENEYFLFDRGMLQPQGMKNVAFRVCQARKDERNPLFVEGELETPPKPWEQRYDNAYPNVIYDEAAGVYRCYFTLCTKDDCLPPPPGTDWYIPGPRRQVSLGYAQSEDGLHWTKPNLCITEIDGSRDNNILMLHAHGTGVFLDQEESDPKKRYKLITKVDYPGSSDSHLAVAFSEDGLRFGPLIRWPKHNPPADTHNFVFRDPQDGRFKLITRLWANGVRLVGLCQSDDFVNWSEPREVFRPQGFFDQVYSMPVFYAKGLYLGLASVLHEGDRDDPLHDAVDLELMYATGLTHFNKAAPGQALIRRGEGEYPDGAFDSGCIYAAAPIKMDGEYCIYYMGANGRHSGRRNGAFARAFIDTERLVALEPKRAGEEAILPLSFLQLWGEKVELLADLKPGGYVKAAVFDRWNGQAYSGFDYGDSVLSPADDGYFKLSFSAPFASLPRGDKTLMLRFLKAEVYNLRGTLTNTNRRAREGLLT